MADFAERAAAVCRELARGDLASIAAEIGAGDTLDRIVAALSRGGEPGSLAAELDELDTILIRNGVAGGLMPPSQRTYRVNPAATAEYPALEIWTCPTQRCHRWQAIDGDEDSGPACAIQGMPMSRKRISG
jgi:hypothetical protein